MDELKEIDARYDRHRRLLFIVAVPVCVISWVFIAALFGFEDGGAFNWPRFGKALAIETIAFITAIIAGYIMGKVFK